MATDEINKHTGVDYFYFDCVKSMSTGCRITAKKGDDAEHRATDEHSELYTIGKVIGDLFKDGKFDYSKKAILGEVNLSESIFKKTNFGVHFIDFISLNKSELLHFAVPSDLGTR